MSGGIVCRDGIVILPDFDKEILVLALFTPVEVAADIALLFSGGFDTPCSKA
ncbi:MAG: hypothetical protein Q4C16_08030 [Eubacteriales bacterium]|jgi:hypothetical protein|nr:hypothetical protein [Eubacteriales bacterium]